MDIPRTRKPNRKPYIYGAIGVLALAGMTLGMSRLRAAAPTVEKGSVPIDASEFFA